jgi:endo-1,4-beta-mannosidase
MMIPTAGVSIRPWLRPAGGRAFDSEGAAPMKFSVGINYWPRRSAMEMWQRFDPGEIADDMHRIADLGLDTVRFFLRWADFQPAPRRMNHVMLKRLVRVVEIVASAGLRAMPTLFCGHMSGVNWLPSWTLDRTRPSGRFRTLTEDGEEPYGAGDLYTGPLLDAQRYHAREVATALRGHPDVVAWDLGNEFSNVREPASPADAREWSKRLSAELQRVSGHPVTGGIHGEDLTRDRNIRPSSIAEPWAFATMHGYSVYSDFARDRTDAAVVPFLAALTASLTQKPVIFSEFGNPTCPPGKCSPYDRVPLPDEPPLPPIPPDDPVRATYACLGEEEMAVYGRAVLEQLHADGRLGAYWWCWADYVPELAKQPPFDRAPHELRFGVVRSDGSLKPVAEVLRAFARERRTVVEPNDPAMFEPAYYADLPRSTRDAYARFLEFRL